MGLLTSGRTFRHVGTREDFPFVLIDCAPAPYTLRDTQVLHPISRAQVANRACLPSRNCQSAPRFRIHADIVDLLPQHGAMEYPNPPASAMVRVRSLLIPFSAQRGSPCEITVTFTR